MTYQDSFSGIDTLWTATIRRLLDYGHAAPKSIELLGYQAKLNNLESTFLYNLRRSLDPVYASAELTWYLSRSRKIDMITKYAPQYEKFANHDEAYGAYGHRIATNCPQGQDQLVEAVRLLRQCQDTRQCVVTLWEAHDLVQATYRHIKDLPCTIAWQFIVRERRLHLIVQMRSNDVWLGTPYDIFINTTIQRMVADELNLGYGTYTHQVGSMHLYHRNLDAARAALVEPCCDIPLQWTRTMPLFATSKILVSNEGRMRLVDAPPEPTPDDLPVTELLACLGIRWGMPLGDKLRSEPLIKGVNRYVDRRRSRLSRQDDIREETL